MKSLRWVALLCAVCFGLVACAGKGATPLSPEDTPPNHYLQGMQLIDQGKAAEADTRFARAVELEPGYAPGLAGQALVRALGVEGQTDAKHAKLEIDAFRDLLRKAWGKASEREAKFIVSTTAIRAETVAKATGWLKAAWAWHGKATTLRNVDEGALPYYRNTEALSHFMGRALYEAGEYAKAKDQLSLVVGADTGKWHEAANALFARIQKIERAMAHYTVTGVAKAIAAKDTVSRADVAVLLVTELQWDKLFQGKLSAKPMPKATFMPADVEGLPFQAEIMDVLKWNVRGLGTMYDAARHAELFKPMEPVTRKEMAFTLEDILIKVTGDGGQATRYFGQDSSPYPDVRPTEPWYNAVMNVVSRNLMETDLTGAFRPNDNLDGAELLLAVVRLRTALN
ncbi:MAG: S-layer homology domain-containing protein [Desulfovibrionaceae bacterium]